MRGLATFVFSVAVSLSAGASARENHAVLIGASQYTNLDEKFWLVGPANDVDLVQTYLITNPHVPFEPGNITLLADGVAGGTPPTLAAIRNAMDGLARRLEPDDFVYLHFSGHGSQAPARDPETELDGLDELFLPVDIGPWQDSVGQVSNALVDDEIGQMIGRLRATGATVWAVFDSCHSGTVTRAAPTGDDDVRLRKLDTAALGIPDVVPEAGRARGLDAGSENAVDAHNGTGPFVAFFAAQTNETTPEKRLPRGMPGRRSQGVFTFTLFEALAARPAVTYRQLGQDILRRYGVNNLARSTPMFEGDLDLAVFGGDNANAVRQWPVGNDDGLYSIAAGRLHGIETGMTLAVMASPADEDDAALGQVTVSYAETFLAEIDAAAMMQTPVPPGAYLRVTQAAANYSLSVALPPAGSPPAAALDRAIAQGRTEEVFGPRIHFVATGQEADLRLGVQKEDGKEETIQVLPATGMLSDDEFVLTPTLTTADKSPAELADALADTLGQIARVQNLLRLGSAFHGDELNVEIALKTRSPKAPRLAQLDTVPVPRLVPDDEIHLQVQNHEDFPVDLNVLYVGSDYSISHMFAGRLHPGDRLKQGLLRITDDSFGRDRVVMILTAARKQSAVEDLSFLAQDELPATRAMGDGSFASTLVEAGFGTTTRAATALVQASEPAAPALLVFDIDTRPAR